MTIAMTRSGARPRHGSTGARVAVLVVVVFGILAMHGLASPATAGVSRGASHVMGHGAGCQVRGDAPDVPCPGDHGGHVGPVCQAGAVSVGTGIAAPVSQAVAVPTDGPLWRLTVTAAVDAADGTGCGPPSLTALSISRT